MALLNTTWYPKTTTYMPGFRAIRIDILETQNVADNSSIINITYTAAYIGTLGTGISHHGSILINGVEAIAISGATDHSNGMFQKSASFVVKHDGVGDASIKIKVQSEAMSGAKWWFIVDDESSTYTLDRIPINTPIDYAGDLTLGNSCDVRWTPIDTGLKYKLKFECKGWEYTTPDFIMPGSTEQYTFSAYTIPESVAQYITDSEWAHITVYLYTFISSGEQINEPNSEQFKALVPESHIPTISSVNAVIVNENDVVNSWKIALQGYSKINISAKAAGVSGSTITSFTISGSYNTNISGLSLNYTGSVIETYGDLKFQVFATDSRGRKSKVITLNSIPCYKYTEPQITIVSSDRLASDKTKVEIQTVWEYANANNHNSAVVVLQMRQAGSDSWSNIANLSDLDVTTATFGELKRAEVDAIIQDIDKNKSFDIRLIVTDALGKFSSAVSFLQTMAVLIDCRQGGKGLGIGKMSEMDALEVALDSVFSGGVHIKIGEQSYSLKEYIQAVIAGTV